MAKAIGMPTSISPNITSRPIAATEIGIHGGLSRGPRPSARLPCSAQQIAQRPQELDEQRQRKAPRTRARRHRPRIDDRLQRFRQRAAFAQRVAVNPRRRPRRPQTAAAADARRVIASTPFRARPFRAAMTKVHRHVPGCSREPRASAIAAADSQPMASGRSPRSGVQPTQHHVEYRAEDRANRGETQARSEAAIDERAQFDPAEHRSPSAHCRCADGRCR